MGLCKCPKRRVTNLFCFVHRVNVCEDCIVSGHPRCVVNSYLKWLEDSDYDAVCILCAHSLQNGPVVRLICYDLFHQSCLDAYARNLSPSAHITCPKCKDNLLPSSNVVSPVAHQLRQVLSNFSWAPQQITTHASSESLHVELDDDSADGPEQLGDMLLTSTPKPSTTQRFDRPAIEESDEYISRSNDENKYQKKSTMSMLSKWSRNHHLTLTVDDGTAMMRRYLLLVFLIVIAIVTLIILLTRVGRGMAEKDPSLNWKYNPHLRISD